MSIITRLENEIKGLETRRLELLEQLELEKSKQKIEIPFKPGNEYFVIQKSGRVTSHYWTALPYHSDIFLQGNAFHSKKEAKRECEKRILLTKFRNFRDKCNGDWKPNFKDFTGGKYSIKYDYSVGDFVYCEHGYIDQITQLGYFKNREDCITAIELFGDEIKQLYVEE